MASVMCILIGNPCINNSRCFSSLRVAVHNWQLAPPAPDIIADIFPSKELCRHVLVDYPQEKILPLFMSSVSGLIKSVINCLILSSFSFAARRKMGRWMKGEFGLVFFQSTRTLKVVICTGLKQKQMYDLVSVFVLELVVYSVTSGSI